MVIEVLSPAQEEDGRRLVSALENDSHLELDGAFWCYREEGELFRLVLGIKQVDPGKLVNYYDLVESTINKLGIRSFGIMNVSIQSPASLQYKEAWQALRQGGPWGLGSRQFGSGLAYLSPKT